MIPVKAINCSSHVRRSGLIYGSSKPSGALQEKTNRATAQECHPLLNIHHFRREAERQTQVPSVVCGALNAFEGGGFVLHLHDH